MVIAAAQIGPALIDVLNLSVAVVGVVGGVVVSILLYRLGRRVDFRSRMQRWDELRATAQRLLPAVTETSVPDVLLVNARRYERDYDGGYGANRHGELQLKVEFHNVRHNGIELFCGIEASYYDEHGHRTRRETGRRAANVLLAGFVPFEYVEHINLAGNEYEGKPIFYVRFRGPGKSPFRHYTFHELSTSDSDMTGRPYHPVVTDLGVMQPGRVRSWVRFWLRRSLNYWRSRRIARKAVAQRHRARPRRSVSGPPLTRSSETTPSAPSLLPGSSPMHELRHATFATWTAPSP